MTMSEPLSGKVVVLLSLLVGLVCGLFFFNQVPVARSAIEEPATDMFGAKLGMRGSSMSCPRQGPVTMSVNAMENALKKYGVPSNPLQRVALAQWAATRDVSMAAQATAKEEFSKLAPENKDSLKKLGKELVVRAASSGVDEYAGVTGPLGFFDPLELANGENIAVLRTAELKHGRVCMAASLGVIVSEVFHPIFDRWDEGEFVSAAASHFVPTAANNFWPAFAVLTGAIEIVTKLKDPDNTGDYGWDPLGLKPDDPEKWIQLQNKELNNGRLAMFGIAGILVQELVTGEKIFR